MTIAKAGDKPRLDLKAGYGWRDLDLGDADKRTERPGRPGAAFQLSDLRRPAHPGEGGPGQERSHLAAY